MAMPSIKILAVCMLIPIAGCSGKDKGPSMGSGENFSSATVVEGSLGPRTMYRGEEVSSIKASGLNTGMVFPDGDGGVVIIEGSALQREPKGYVDARELRLKIRELAEQLIAGIDDNSLKGVVALPTSFVSQDDFNQTSSFGRFVSEQLFYEFNQRGFPIREYRISDYIAQRENGEFYLTRELGDIALPNKGAVVIAGTYYSDPQAVFLNARLLRPSDGCVLRTASMVLRPNSLTHRMIARPAKKIQSGQMRIRDYEDAVAPKAYSPFDFGQDIH